MRNVINGLKNLFGNLFYGATYDTRTGQETINWPTPKAQYSPAPPQQPYNPTPTPTPQQQYAETSGTYNIPYQTDTETKMVPGNLAQAIGSVFPTGDIGAPYSATDAASILSHPYEEQVKGYGRGENQNFQVIIDVPNRIDKNGNWDDNAPIKTFTSPFPSLGILQSIDRGLFRINNEAFLDLLADPKTRTKMYSVGIIDDTHPKFEGLTPTVLQNYWDRMNDPLLNIKMAKIMLDERGVKAWYAAPKKLVGKGQLALAE